MSRMNETNLQLRGIKRRELQNLFHLIIEYVLYGNVIKMWLFFILAPTKISCDGCCFNITPCHGDNIVREHIACCRHKPNNMFIVQLTRRWFQPPPHLLNRFRRCLAGARRFFLNVESLNLFHFLAAVFRIWNWPIIPLLLIIWYTMCVLSATAHIFSSPIISLFFSYLLLVRIVIWWHSNETFFIQQFERHHLPFDALSIQLKEFTQISYRSKFE